MERLVDAAHSPEEADFRPCNSRVNKLQRQHRPLYSVALSKISCLSVPVTAQLSR